MPEFLADDLEDDNTKRFAKLLKYQRTNYALGDMEFIMRLMKSGGKTLQRSALLKGFRIFSVRYFGEYIVDGVFLDQIKKINEDFRRKAAHPYILGADDGRKCRELVRSCLNELIQNYSSAEASGNNSQD